MSEFDTYKSCNGCPKRTATCHGPCPGYQQRRAEMDQAIAGRVAGQAGMTWIGKEAMNRRITNARDRKARRKRG